MYEIFYNNEWIEFDSLTDAESYVEMIYNKYDMDYDELPEIVPYSRWHHM